MSLASTVRTLVLAGATPEMILAVVENHERETADALARRRESDKVRQQAIRDRKSMTIEPASRDVTLPVCDSRDASPHVGERAQVVTPSLPSLRSEELKTPTEPNGSVPPKRAKAARRCPEAWSPSEKTLATLTAENHSAGDLERALTRMRDYEFARSHTDWDACFRTWVRKDADRKSRQSHERPSPDAKRTARDQILATHERGADLAARRWHAEHG